MTRPGKSSIERQLTAVIMRTSIAVLLVTVTAFIIYDWVTFRHAMVRNLVTQAQIIAENCSAAVAFQNEDDAENVLASLRSQPHVTAALIYDAQGNLFAKYPASILQAAPPAATPNQNFRFGKSDLTVVQPIVQSGAKLGMLYLRSDLTEVSQRFNVYWAISLLITAGSLSLAAWLTTTLQRRISNPIVALAATARDITGERNFSVRANKTSNDELGDLTDAFNTMLDQIQRTHWALEKSRAQLQIVTDYASVLLCHVDRNQVFHFVNPAYAGRFKLTPQMAIGRSIHEVVGTGAYQTLRPYIERALAGERVEFELEIPYEQLGPRWMHCIYVPEQNDAGLVAGFVGIINDVTARKQAAEALRLSERRERERAEELAILIEAIPTPVIIVHDREARHMTGNAAAHDLLMIPPRGEISMSASDELKPRHLKVFQGGRELRQEELPAQRAARGELVRDFGIELVFEDGTAHNLLAYGTPLLDEQGQSRGAVHTLVDITELKRAEAKLREAKEAAEMANRSKDDFLAALSHELRTPLNPVLLVASDAANNPQISGPTRADFEMILRNVELEARLIDDLLDLTRISRGKLLLDRRPLDVHTVLREALAIVQADMEIKQIQVILDLAADPPVVSGDPVRLLQIFWNLLKNAVKFTPAGGRIQVATRAPVGRPVIIIQITDTGIGLTAEEIDRIFNVFVQGDHASQTGSHRFGGLGLGLVISRGLIDLHDGVIHAASAGRDQGATFTIELPRNQVAETNEPAPPMALKTDSSFAATGPKNPLSILLVEDHDATRIALENLLKRRNHQVVTAASVAEARALAHLHPFDLLISDIGLPDGNGNALMAELKVAFGLKGIALTGYGMDHDLAAAQNAGFIAHLTKPIRIEALEKVLLQIA